MAYNYLRILEDAISDAYFAMEQDDLDNSHTVEELVKAAEVRHELPEPVACHAEICIHPSSCAMSVEPRAGSYLLDIVESPEISREQSLSSLENDKWHIQLVSSDFSAVSEARAKNLGYLDYKYVIQGNRGAGPVVFKITTTQKGYVFLCQPPGR